MKNYRCNNCDKGINTADEVVAHYKEKHPLDAYQCANVCNKTWDPALDVLLKENRDLKGKARDAASLENQLEDWKKQHEAIRIYAVSLERHLAAIQVLVNLKR